MARRVLARQPRRFFSAGERLDYDVAVVGGGVAGLSTAISVKQHAARLNKEVSVCVLEKGSAVGSHVLSGNVFDHCYLGELFPQWETMENRPPLRQKVTEDSLYLQLSQARAVKVPQVFVSQAVRNHGKYLISLGELCAWLAERAGELGVDVLPGFAGDRLLINPQTNTVEGVATKETGVDRRGERKESYQAGVDIAARVTVLAEGARGSMAEKAIGHFNLRANCDPQIYGIGVKEVWQGSGAGAGAVIHSVGWPLDSATYGGGFLYKMHDGLIHLGLVVGLDYKNPYLNPYEEFQRWKTSALVRPHLEGASCVKYGARVINEGGYYSIPRLAFPGGVLVGCAAGFVNVMKIKGSHNAMKSGITAGRAIAEHLASGAPLELYEKAMGAGPVFKELWESRNFKGGFKKGLYWGLANGALVSLTKGREPYSLRVRERDAAAVEPSARHQPIAYPRHDGVLTFDLLESLSRSGTHHEENQPKHLVVKPEKKDAPDKSLRQFAGFEERFCPAKVYEFVENDKGEKRLQINAQNCVHCKTCSIKSLEEYIDWRVPQGGDGPEYTIM